MTDWDQFASALQAIASTPLQLVRRDPLLRERVKVVQELLEAIDRAPCDVAEIEKLSDRLLQLSAAPSTEGRC